MGTTTDIDTEILELCKSFKDGITYQILQNSFQDVKLQELVKVINSLLQQNKVDLLTQSDGSLLIKYKNVETKSRFQGGSCEEELIVKLISESESDGIEAKELRFKTNLDSKTITKILKSLEKTHVIKFFNAIAAPKRKRYILYNSEPNPELLGGELYNANEYDTSLIGVLTDQCYKFLERKAADAKIISEGPFAALMASWSSSQEVLKYIQSLGIVNVSLKESEIDSILESLYYDGKLEQSNSSSASANKIYRAVKTFSTKSTLMSIPCGYCPRINECGDVGTYSSLNCKYMNEFEF